MSSALSYVPLWCKSNYSFLEGASHPEELVAEANTLRLSRLALCDRNGVYGLPRAYQQSEESNTKLICGAQLSIQKDESPSSGVSQLLALVKDKAGWKNLCRLLSRGALRCEKGENRIFWSELSEHAEGIVALWGGEGSALYGDDTDTWRDLGEQLKEAFGARLYAVISRHNLLCEARTEPRALLRAHRLNIAPVACRETLYHHPSRREIQDVLTCIKHGVTLQHAGRKLRPNGRFELLSPEEFWQLYRDMPEAIERSVEIADSLEFSLRDLSYRYPDEPLPQGKSSARHLQELAFEGARKRYPEGISQRAKEQLQKELSLILKLGFVGYFLTMYEIVGYCRDNGILCQGRGSAANSIVCFCLGITAVDPIKLGLLFERFISEERAEPPDIDLDISHQRREEVIAWVYERYGREHAAMVCNVVRYRSRSAVREVGKVLQIELATIEALARLMTGYSEGVEDEVLKAAGLDPERGHYRLFLKLVNDIQNFPRHLSIHPGGFLLGGEPVCELVPIENATMEGRTVIQWDKYDVDNLGLFKVDLLGLGALSQLDRAFRLLHSHRGLNLSMASLPVNDPGTFAMLSRGDSVGVFQIESRAQMAMLPSLQPCCFYDLVIQVAIVRPGPITGGMVNPYLRRRSGEEDIEYPHPSLRPVLEKTLGVPLFQEQVMKLAVVAADYTPGEADQLRRDMAAWQSQGKLERHRHKLISRMIGKGIEPEFAERVFNQIKGFGEYGFPESHAASFALITYATSYLRCHYPAEFTCALLNSLPMGFYSASTLLEDARRKGIEVRNFCVQASQWECTLEAVDNGGAEHLFALRLGLKFLKGLGESVAEKITAAQDSHSTRELCLRADLDKSSLEILASSGALDCYGNGRRQELWRATTHLQMSKFPLLRHLDERTRDLPTLSESETIVWDYQSAGLSSRGHPLKTLREELKKAGFPDAQTIQRSSHGRYARYCGLVICRQRPATAKGTTFFTLEDETGFVNVIVWPQVFQENFLVARSANFLGVEGKVQNARGVVHLVAEKLYRPKLGAPIEVTSRNFH